MKSALVPAWPDLDVLVLAAGQSQRLREILGDRPKPLIDVLGEPVLVRNLRWLAGHRMRRVWINLHYGAAAIQAALGDGTELGLRIHYSYERELLGTAGAARALAGLWRHWLLVVYGDSLLNFDLSRFLSLALSSAAETAWLTVLEPGVNPATAIAGSALLADAEHRLLGFQETRNRNACPGDRIAAGVYCLPAAWLRALPERYPLDFGQDVFPLWLEQNKVLKIYPMDGYCLGMDTPATYRQALELIRAHNLLLS